MEKQKNSLLSEELRIKKGSVERLRTELENTKEQLEYLREEKGNRKMMLFRLFNALTLQVLKLSLFFSAIIIK